MQTRAAPSAAALKLSSPVFLSVVPFFSTYRSKKYSKKSGKSKKVPH